MAVDLDTKVGDLLPEGGIATGAAVLMSWMDEGGAPKWAISWDMEMPVTSILGLLELAKIDVIARCNTGLPLAYPPGEE